MKIPDTFAHTFTPYSHTHTHTHKEIDKVIIVFWAFKVLLVSHVGTFEETIGLSK